VVWLAEAVQEQGNDDEVISEPEAGEVEPKKI